MPGLSQKRRDLNVKRYLFQILALRTQGGYFLHAIPTALTFSELSICISAFDSLRFVLLLCIMYSVWAIAERAKVVTMHLCRIAMKAEPKQIQMYFEFSLGQLWPSEEKI